MSAPSRPAAYPDGHDPEPPPRLDHRWVMIFGAGPGTYAAGQLTGGAVVGIELAALTIMALNMIISLPAVATGTPGDGLP